MIAIAVLHVLIVIVNEWAAVGVCTVTGVFEYIVYLCKASTNARLKGRQGAIVRERVIEGHGAFWLAVIAVAVAVGGLPICPPTLSRIR